MSYYRNQPPPPPRHNGDWWKFGDDIAPKFYEPTYETKDVPSFMPEVGYWLVIAVATVLLVVVFARLTNSTYPAITDPKIANEVCPDPVPDGLNPLDGYDRCGRALDGSDNIDWGD